MWGNANYYPLFFFYWKLERPRFWYLWRFLGVTNYKEKKTWDMGNWEWCSYPELGNSWCAGFLTSVFVLTSHLTMVSRQTVLVCSLTAELKKRRGLSQESSCQLCSGRFPGHGPPGGKHAFPSLARAAGGIIICSPFLLQCFDVIPGTPALAGLRRAFAAFVSEA